MRVVCVNVTVSMRFFYMRVCDVCAYVWCVQCVLCVRVVCCICGCGVCEEGVRRRRGREKMCSSNYEFFTRKYNFLTTKMNVLDQCEVAFCLVCGAEIPSWLGDGWCDGDLYNNVCCGWDGGDCCPDSCVDSTHPCGVAGYNCCNANLKLGEWKCRHTRTHTHTTHTHTHTHTPCKGSFIIYVNILEGVGGVPQNFMKPLWRG